MKKRLGHSLLLILLAMPVTALADWVTGQWDVMGTRAKVELWQEKDEGEAVIDLIRDEFNRLNQLLSPWHEDSELAQANAQAASRPVKISDEFAALLRTSRHYNILTDGAFDITFASAGHLYDYRTGQSPDDDTLKEAVRHIGMGTLMLHPDNTISFSEPGTRIDLGGIAKGYAIDRAVSILRDAGIQHAWVSLGGDSYTLGDRRGRLWQVGIRHPRSDSEVILKIPVEDLAVSTSGDYERFFIEDGQRVHHIINPATGRSAGELASVTILAQHSIDADALSTSVFVMGKERGMKLVESMEGVSAIMVTLEGEVLYSSDLVPSG